MTPLFGEIHRWAGMGFQWGESDCVMVVADWVRRVRGVDPAAAFRLTYCTAGECQRVTRFFTDPLGVVGDCMDAAGLVVTAAPVRGDVGVLLHPVGCGAHRPHMALCLGENWAVKAESGVEAYRPYKILRAWSVGYVDA